VEPGSVAGLLIYESLAIIAAIEADEAALDAS
jgi:hypothetical protein